MTAIVASPTAMAAIWKSNAAVTAVKNNATAWKTFTGATSAVMGKTVAILANLNPADYADMTAVAASQTAMTAIQKSQTAKDAIAASSMATAKYAAGAAGLNPADYADMSTLAASQTAMAAVAASQTAMTAVAASQTAMTAVATAWETTESIITSSSVALNALKNSGKCEAIKKDVSGAKSISFYSGLCFVFTAQITVTGDRCAIKATRPTGSSTLTLCSSVTTTTVNKFCKDPYVQCTDSGHNYANNYLYCYKI